MRADDKAELEAPWVGRAERRGQRHALRIRVSPTATRSRSHRGLSMGSVAFLDVEDCAVGGDLEVEFVAPHIDLEVIEHLPAA